MNPTFLQVFNEVANSENISSKDDSREKDIRPEANPIKSITANTINKLTSLKKTEIS
jgi:hypothetical protein